ncbi:MAG: thioredoxin-disulfide reductase [Candidatus Omnitrophica bacterium]|nr:thioredoxin-disulfide reductase [Candidatus Omnitrophota bacterium]
MHEVIIIGAGPAGLTAAIYTSRARLKTLVLEDISVMSQTAYADRIENYPGFPKGTDGLSLLESFKKQAKGFGAEFITGKAEEITARQVKVDGKRYDTLSVIIATGARARKLDIPGEDKLCGKGVSYCATCDGAFFKDKDIVVVGGGDTAIQEAIFLTRFARKVMVIHRRDRLRATKILQEQALSNKKIEVIWNSVAEEILGTTKVEGVKIKNLAKSQERKLSCEGVFVSIGFVPNTAFLKGKLELNDKGYIIVDGEMRTSEKGIFACGDCRNTPLRQIVTACGDGAIAAFSCQHYVEELKGTSYE